MYNGVTASKVSRYDNGYLRFGPIYIDLVFRVTGPRVHDCPVVNMTTGQTNGRLTGLESTRRLSRRFLVPQLSGLPRTRRNDGTAISKYIG